MRQARFQAGKNDFFFAFVVAAMFAFTVVGVVAGVLDLARGNAGVVVAKAQELPGAARSAGAQVTQVARADPGRRLPALAGRGARHL
ncbi:MAG TPA: hypothetical protein VH183_02465 [Burkholderiaceae bacterium]|jgi:hypothetical protein|nr:hypothetical protein [Burkholderiaceae bacterium]